MSFEQIMQDHTVALREHAAALLAFVQHKPVEAKNPNAAFELSDKERAKLKEIGESPVKDTKQKESVQQAAKSEPEPQIEEVEVEDTAKTVVDFETLKGAVLAVAKKAREEAVALLARFGATKISELKPDSYNDAHQLALDIVAGKTSALASDDAEALA